MAEPVVLWHITPGDVTLTPSGSRFTLMRLDIGRVRVMLDRAAPDAAGQAVAMRELARLATEAAEELERPAPDTGEGGSDVVP